MKKLLLLLSIVFLLAACGPAQGPAPTSQSQGGAQPAAQVQAPASSPTPTFSPTILPTATSSVTPSVPPTATFTPSPSETPTPESTATPTGTATPLHPTAVSKANTNCRYGPNTAYLYMYGLMPGGTAEVHGRDYAAAWLWVQPADTDLLCWVATSSMTLPVDVKTVPVEYPPLPVNPAVPPPTGVHATRSADKVTIHWDAAAPAVQLGYLIEASVCYKGNLIDFVATTTATSYTLSDAAGCKQASSGQVRVQNKKGYSTAVKVHWP